MYRDHQVKRDHLGQLEKRGKGDLQVHKVLNILSYYGLKLKIKSGNVVFQRLKLYMNKSECVLYKLNKVIVPYLGSPGSESVLESLKSEIQQLKAKIATIEKIASFSHFRQVGQKYYFTDGVEGTFSQGLKYCEGFGGTMVLPRSSI